MSISKSKRKRRLPVKMTKQNTRFDLSYREDNGNSFNIIHLVPTNIFFPQNTKVFLERSNIIVIISQYSQNKTKVDMELKQYREIPW